MAGSVTLKKRPLWIRAAGFVMRLPRRVVSKLIAMYYQDFAGVRRLIGPRVGMLSQYQPRKLRVPSRYAHPQPLHHRPKISIVTACLNHGAYLERTIRSVLGQRYPALQYVIRDGASTDNTMQVLERYSDAGIDWKSEPDGGQTEGLNKGFRATDGEIMAYLNSDDMLMPGTLNHVAACFANHPDIDVVYGHRILIDEQDHDIGKWVMPEHDDEILRWVDYVPQETLFWRRSIWEKAGGRLDDSYDFAMDWELLLRFMDAGARIKRLPRYLGAFRVHPEQKTTKLIQQQGSQEMTRLLEKCHGTTVGQRAVRRKVATFLVRQMIYDRVYRLSRAFSRHMDVMAYYAE